MSSDTSSPSKAPRRRHKQIDYDLVRALVMQRWTMEKIAKTVGHSLSTFKRRMEWDAKLSEAVNSARIELTEDQYRLAHILSMAQCKDTEIAQMLKMTPRGFAMRLGTDPALHDAVMGGRLEGVARVRRGIYQAMMDRRLTVCMDCDKIVEGAYRKSCPYCDELDPENVGQHTNVKHKMVPGSVPYTIFWLKNFGGMADKVIHEGGDADRPMLFSTLADFVKAQAEKTNGSRKEKDT